MKYTLAGGVDHRDDDIHRGLLVSLPVIAGVLLLGLLGARHVSHHPVTGPAYSSFTAASKQSPTNTPNSNNSTNGGSTGSGGTVTGNQAIPQALATVNPQANNSAPVSSAANTAPQIGGMGGGTSGGTGGSGGGTTTPAPGTIMCNNSGGLLPITCTACTPAIVVLVGQKAVASSSGSCTLVN